MKKILDAEDMIHQAGWSSGDQLDITAMSNLMIKFAKLHVEAALKAAGEKARSNGTYKSKDGHLVNGGIDKDSILTAYPLDKIE